MGVTLLAVAVLALAGCAGTYQGPILSDAERCVRFGGFWMDNQCQVQDLRW
jgi:hypothetical protein